MRKDKKKNELEEYRIWKLTLLQLMTVLALLGVGAYVFGRWWMGG